MTRRRGKPGSRPFLAIHPETGEEERTRSIRTLRWACFVDYVASGGGQSRVYFAERKRDAERHGREKVEQFDRVGIPAVYHLAPVTPDDA